MDLQGEDIFYMEVLPALRMFFDGAARRDGAGVLFESLENHLLPYSFTLTQLCLNILVEYQALLLGLQMAIETEIDKMDLYGDSELVINQVLDDYEVRKNDLILYHKKGDQLLSKFDSINICHVPRSANKLVDALVNLAANLAQRAEQTISIHVCNCWVVPPSEKDKEDTESSNVIFAYEVEREDWRQPIIEFLDHQKLTADSKYKSFDIRNGFRVCRTYKEFHQPFGVEDPAQFIYEGFSVNKDYHMALLTHTVAHVKDILALSSEWIQI